MSEKRAYYVEYPDKEMAVIIKHDEGGEPTVWSLDYTDPDDWIAILMTEDYETFAYTSTVHHVEDREMRHWVRIDPATLKDTYVMDMDSGHARRKQLRKGRVVEARDHFRKGKTPWDEDVDPQRNGVYPVPVPLASSSDAS